MKFSKVYAIFLAIFVLNSSLSTNFLLENPQIDKMLHNYVCQITKDIMKSTNDTQDVLIGNLDSNTKSSTINDVVECIGADHPVVISDMIQPLTEKNLRKAAVMILFFKTANKVSYLK